MNQPIFSFLALLLCLSGCAVSGKDPAAKSVRPASSAVGDDFANVPVQKVNDPLQGFNRTMFGFNDELNTHAWRPLAHGYVIVVPRPVRNGISNFFDNVQFPVRFVNSVLQGKLTRSAQEVGKFVFNSTFGVGGLIRVSDHVSGLTDVPAEDFGQTLGVWGIPRRSLHRRPGAWPLRLPRYRRFCRRLRHVSSQLAHPWHHSLRVH